MKNFIKNTLLFFIPLLIIVLIYAVVDPFKVLKQYNAYYDGAIPYVQLNGNHVAVNTLKNNIDSINYNSFVFGNSRSFYIKTSSWQKYLKPTDRLYHFNATGESLFAMEKKFVFLDRNKIPMENALIVLDESILGKTVESNELLTAMSPDLDDKKSWFDFHYLFFKSALDSKFAIAYAKKQIGKY